MIQSLQQVETETMLWLQASLSQAPEILIWFTYLGYGPVYLILMSFVFWCLDPRLGFRLGIGVTLAGALTEILKFAFHAPRPFWLEPTIRAYTADISFGMPSGHALAGLAFWGLWAWSVRKPWQRWLMLSLAFLIGASRVQLGVHFPSQVISGWAVATILVVLMLRLEEPWSDYWKKRGKGAGLATVLICGAALVVAGLAILKGLEAWTLPQEWVRTAAAAAPRAARINPLNPSALIINTSLFCGIWSSRVLGNSSSRESFEQLAGRTLTVRFGLWLAGMVGAGVIILVLAGGAKAMDGPRTLTLICYGIAGVATGLWLFWLGPGLMGRLGRGAS